MGKHLDEFLTEFLASWYNEESAFENFDQKDQGSHDYVRAYLRYKKDETGTPRDFDNTPDAFTYYKALCCDLDADDKALNLRINNDEFYIPLQGDWMCSVGWMARFGLIYVYEDDNKKLLEKFGECKKGTGKARFSINNKEHLDFLLKGDNFKNFDTFNNPKFQKFVRAAYTRANLIFVPNGVNTRRHSYDFWDIALAKLLGKTDGLEAYRKCFQSMLKKYYKEGLFLEEWLTEQRELLMLPGHKNMEVSRIECQEDWEKVLTEMTARIITRRDKIKAFLEKQGHSASLSEDQDRWILDKA